MDISKLVFYHYDLGPTDLLVNPSTGSLGIIDWELAGYVPIEWVKTKFDSQQEWTSIMGMRTLRRTGAAELPSIWKRWATGMLWMHGGSFRPARYPFRLNRDLKSHRHTAHHRNRRLRLRGPSALKGHQRIRDTVPVDACPSLRKPSVPRVLLALNLQRLQRRHIGLNYSRIYRAL